MDHYNRRGIILKKNIRLLSFIILLLFTLKVNIIFAGTYDYDENYNKKIINHYLTLEKIRKWEYEAEHDRNKNSLNKLRNYNGQTIFWRGYINNFETYKPHSFTLKIGQEEIWVYCNEKTRNIDVDRTGCKVGVKGKIVIQDDKFSYIEGKSVVLMIPPPGEQYSDFQLKNKISSRFTINTTEGPVEMEDNFYPFIIYWVMFHNPGYDMAFAEAIAKSTVYYSHMYGLDPKLALALFTIESAMDYDAVSSAGAVGFGQLMPGTAAGLGVDPYDSVQNIGGSVRLIKSLLNEWSSYDNCRDLALASYNAGTDAVYSYGGIPPYSETQNYVFFINFIYEHIKKSSL